VLVVILSVPVFVALRYDRRAGSDVGQFFLSGRDLPWWLAGTSIVATTFAADTPWLSIARSAVSAASATVRPFRSSRPSTTSAKTERIGISTRPGPSRTVFLSRR
jgi:hypothetical protein